MNRHGDIHHSDYYLGTEPRRKWLVKKIYCPITQRYYSKYKQLSEDLNKLGKDTGDYFLQYGQEFLPEKWAANVDDVLGNARNEPFCKECGASVKWNRYKIEFPAFCGFSCSTKWYAENTDRIHRAMSTMELSKQQNPDFQLGPMHQKYWTLRGYSQQDAEKKVKERQAVGS